MLFQNSSTPDIHPGLLTYIQNAADWSLYHPSVNSSAKPASKDAGLTFEHLLDVEVNSRASADLCHLGTEVKTGRDQSGSLLTLFTKNPPRKLRTLTLEFGMDVLTEERDRRSFYHTHSNKTKTKFELRDSEDKMLLMSGEDIVAHWTEKQLRDAMKKLDRLCYAKVNTKVIDGREHFRFHSFEFYYGFKAETYYEHLLSGEAVVDFRAHIDHLKKSKLRDHGTAFRVDVRKLGPTYYSGFFQVDLGAEAISQAA